MRTRCVKCLRLSLTSDGRGWTEAVQEAPEFRSFLTPASATRQQSRCGYSLLELIVAMSLLSVVLTATSSVLRTSRQVWEAHEADLTRLKTAHAVVRHIVREVREAQEVVDVDADQPVGGKLTVRLTDGDELTWQHDGSASRVLFTQASVSTSAQVVAEQIDSLEFRPILIDGSAFEPDKTDRIQELTVLAGVTLPRETPVTRNAVASVWLRAFGRNRSQ
ncbi:prepilin-type N-terminal cleavage/methylation domain-containing protein [bacterium]|nr:prepilin-type N-terminal cleavage/methylation domain-containing protein [bacterium]